MRDERDSVYGIRPDNKYLHAATEALRSILRPGAKYDLEERVIEQQAYTDLAWSQLTAFVQENHDKRLPPREKEELGKLVALCTLFSIDVSRDLFKRGADHLRRAHDCERLFDSAAHHLKLSASGPLRAFDPGAPARTVGTAREGGIVSVLREEFGAKGILLSDGFSARTVKNREELFKIFEEALDHHFYGSHKIREAMEFFCKRYRDIKCVAQKADEQGGTAGAKALKDIHTQLFAMENEVRRHLQEMEPHLKYYEWIEGKRDVIADKYPGQHFDCVRHPKRELEDLTRLLDHYKRDMDVDAARAEYEAGLDRFERLSRPQWAL